MLVENNSVKQLLLLMRNDEAAGGRLSYDRTCASARLNEDAHDVKTCRSHARVHEIATVNDLAKTHASARID